MIIDIVVLAVLLISALIAFLRGLIRELLTIAGVVGGFAAAYVGGPFLNPVMDGWLGVEDGVELERLFGILPYDILSVALSYGLIFIVVVVILSFVSHFLAETAKKIGLGAVDRSLGFVFGLLRGVLLLGLMYLPIYLFVEAEVKEEYLKDTKTVVLLEKTSEAIASFIPEKMTENIEQDIKSLSDKDETRSRLEEIDLLKEQKERMQKDDDTSSSEQGEKGYSDVIRQEMDQLIEDAIDDHMDRSE